MANFLLSGLLVLVTAVWGWTFLVVRDSVMTYSVLGFLAHRFTVASVCLGLFSLRRLTCQTFLVGAGIGLSLAIGYLSQTYGLRYTTPTNSGLITGLFVAFAPIASYSLFRVHIDRAFLLPLGICLVGTVLLVGESPETLRIGNGLTLGCAASFGLYIALLSRYANSHDAMPLALAQMISIALLYGLPWLRFHHTNICSATSVCNENRDHSDDGASFRDVFWLFSGGRSVVLGTGHRGGLDPGSACYERSSPGLEG